MSESTCTSGDKKWVEKQKKVITQPSRLHMYPHSSARTVPLVQYIPGRLSDLLTTERMRVVLLIDAGESRADWSMWSNSDTMLRGGW